MDFENEEESKISLVPKSSSEVLGITEWDGQGLVGSRGNDRDRLQCGLLLVTHTGATYYFNTQTKKDRDDWILHVKHALECHFANPEILPFKPSKMIQDRPPLATSYGYCAKTFVPLTSSAVYCGSCGRGFASIDYVNDFSTMLQIGVEESERVCNDCKTSQTIVLWLKSLTYLHAMTVHELSPDINKNIKSYKASFQLRRRISPRLDMAAQLLEQVQ